MVTKEQRRRQLAREKFERQQQRRTERRSKARRRNAIVAAVLAVVLAAGGALAAAGLFTSDGKGNTGGQDVASDSTPSATPSKGPDPCEKPAAGSPGRKQWDKQPPMTVNKAAKYTAKLETTCGVVTLELDPAKAPATVNSFAFLAGQRYFDHTKCHRLTSAGIFVLQCGDPTGTGQGGPGYELKDENLKDKSVADGTYPKGTVAMANAGANTGGSQFFLVYKDSPLPADYTPFGRITGGMDVLEKIAKAGDQTGAGDGPPNATVVIDRFTVAKA